MSIFRSKYLKTLLLPFILFIVLLVTCLIDSENTQQFKNNIKSLKLFHGSRNEQIKTILFWNAYFYTDDYFFGMGRKPFIEKCEVNNCYATNNRSYQDLDKFDAVLIHSPLFDPVNMSDLPSKRSPDQYYAVLTHENPIKFPGYDGFPDLFNLTMNYRLDSDIILPFFRFYDTENKYVGPKLFPKWLAPIHDENYLKQFIDIYERKSKPVAWIYSNCYSTFNMRNEYTSELQKYVSVDTYGLCGKHVCDRKGNNSCYKLLKNDYFFYLSFENANCVDYVSEKLHTPMKYETIAITLNSADMTRMAPPHSFIDARKYEPKELAKYLKYLMANPMEYLKYHWWRKTYYVEVLDSPDPHCRLCEFLNSKHKEEHKSYKDYQEWYRGSSGNEMCTGKILINNDYIPSMDDETDFERTTHELGVNTY